MAEPGKLGLPALTAMVVGSMVGAGIFSLPQTFGRVTGGLGALIAWAIAGGGMLTLAFGMLFYSFLFKFYTLTGGGPAGSTTTLPLYIANTSVDAHDFGYASALTTVAFVILLFCSMVYLRLSKFGGEK